MPGIKINHQIQCFKHMGRLCFGTGLAAVILIGCNTTYAAKFDGFIEVGPEEFESLVIGNTITGKILGGNYRNYYYPGGEIKDVWNGAIYKGKWVIGENNCVMLTLAIYNTRCWILLKNPDGGTYYYGMKTKKGKYHTMYEAKILEGDQSGYD